MKTGEVAKMMGVSVKTVTNWTDQEELSQFFSVPARASEIESAQRDYSTDDIYVLNTIRLIKTRQNSWRDVSKILASGHRETELPLSATMAKTLSPLDQAASMMVLKAERDTALAQLEDATFEIERLRKELENERERGQRMINEEHDKSAKTLADLYKLVGRLEQQVETLQAELKKPRRE
jgi:DNA-binding transcriptional MerR regulator